MAIFIVRLPYLLTTKLRSVIHHNLGHSSPEVVGSNLYQKNIGAQFTHSYVPSLCKEFFVMRHNIGHSKLIRPHPVNVFAFLCANSISPSKNGQGIASL